MSKDKTQFQSEFGQRIKELRRQKDLSQHQVADMLGMHFTNIIRYERGLARPNSETLKKLADIFSVPSGYLIDGDLDQQAQAQFDDKELLLHFQQIQALPEEDKATIKKLIEAFIFARKVQSLSPS